MLSATRLEAERLLGISEKLLQNRDLMGSKEFAILAQETEPLLEGSDQILAIIDVLIASEKRVNNNPDWYSILQIDRRSDDGDLIKKQYRRLALLLHPDKSRFHFADHAFKLVADAWAVLSDPIKKSNYDKELSFFSRVDLSVPGWVQQDKVPVPGPVRRTGPVPGPETGAGPRNSAAAARDGIAADENARRRNATFWTACPYCYRLYEFPKVYEGYCLKCPNCERSFHGVNIPSLPPLVPGQDAYYCCWGFFPMGFVLGNVGSEEKETELPETETVPVPISVQAAAPFQPAAASFQSASVQPASSLPNWMPAPVPVENGGNNVMPVVPPRDVVVATPARVTTRSGVVSNGVAPRGSGTGKKRGRPRKYY
ncbi:uncharacterized protein LOC131620667 [Vicia villosa]|uniref:uncharacterized protein LOC131620667 n=1 Tax=Vicia villosa TaxID=3911 RepID=UPI00273AC4A0|nr:uncharacterized protein LOC131620667 [Vicia villosa]